MNNVMFEPKLIECLSRLIRQHTGRRRAAVVIAVGKQLDLQDMGLLNLKILGFRAPKRSKHNDLLGVFKST